MAHNGLFIKQGFLMATDIAFTMHEQPIAYDNDQYILLETKKCLNEKLSQINPQIYIVSRPMEEFHFDTCDYFVLSLESANYREEITEKLKELGSEIRYSIIDLQYTFKVREIYDNEPWDINQKKTTIAIKRTAFHNKSGICFKKIIVDSFYYFILVFLSFTMYLMIK